MAKHIAAGGTAPIPKNGGTCPECDSRIRQNKADGTLYCSSCEWKQKRGE